MFPLPFIVFLAFHVYIVKPINIYLAFSVVASMFKICFHFDIRNYIPIWSSSFFCFFKFYVCIYLFIYLWLCWVFVSVRGLSLIAASGGHSSSRCAGLSLSRPLLLRSTGSRRAGSVIVAHGPSCSVACGIFPDQGSNPCPLRWQADSQPLRHQGSPDLQVFNFYKKPESSGVFFNSSSSVVDQLSWYVLYVCMYYIFFNF